MTMHTPEPDLARLGGSSRWRPLYWAAMRFWSGTWLRRFAHRQAEDNLERVHHAHGANSLLYRHAFGNAEAKRFAAEFGAVEDAVVRRVVEIAISLGADLDDLRVLALNKRLFSTPDGHVQVRLAWGERWIASFPSIFAWGTWLILALHTLRQHGPAWLKGAVIAVVSVVVAFLWCGWYLYYRGPWVSGNRSKSFIDRASRQRLMDEAQVGAKVVSLKVPGSR